MIKVLDLKLQVLPAVKPSRCQRGAKEPLVRRQFFQTMLPAKYLTNISSKTATSVSQTYLVQHSRRLEGSLSMPLGHGRCDHWPQQRWEASTGAEWTNNVFRSRGRAVSFTSDEEALQDSGSGKLERSEHRPPVNIHQPPCTPCWSTTSIGMVYHILVSPSMAFQHTWLLYIPEAVIGDTRHGFQ